MAFDLRSGTGASLAVHFEMRRVDERRVRGPAFVLAKNANCQVLNAGC
jgi:hypothetical protein